MIESLNPSNKPTPELQERLNKMTERWEIARLNGASFPQYQLEMAMIAFVLSERERLENE